MSRMVYFIIVVTFIDTFIQLPIMTPFALNLGATETMAGLIIAIYSATNVLGNIIGGYWVDRFGRKNVLIAGIVLAAGIVLLYPMSQTPYHLLTVRAIHGLAGGILIPCVFAIVGDQTARKDRKPMAFIGAGIGSAAILGPAAGGILAAAGQVAAVFYLVSVLFAICIWLSIRYVKETYRSSERIQGKLIPFSVLMKNKILQQASLAAFALMVSNGTLAFALPLKSAEMGLSEAATGIWLSIFGITAMIVFLTKLNRVFDRFESLYLVVAGLSFITVSLFMIQWQGSQWSLPVLMILYGVGFALIFPSMNQMVTDMSTKSSRGKAFGIFYSFFSMGVVAGSGLSGVVSDRFDLPFAGSAMVIAISCVVLLVLEKQRRLSGQ